MKTITAIELKKKLDNNEVLLIDVREPSEYAVEYIKNSHLIPLGELSEEKLPLKAHPIVIHCRSGHRSEVACKKLLAQDPSIEVCSLEGGIVAWKNAGFDVQKG